MAIEFARTEIHRRSRGQSAVAAAAYRAGECLEDERTGETHDYRERAADVLYRELLLPVPAPAALADRAAFWNAVEWREDRSPRQADAQVAKDHLLALPRELTPAQRIDLVRGFVREYYLANGLAVDLTIHAHSAHNPHAHLLHPTRTLSAAGFELKARAANGMFYRGRRLADPEQLRHRWAAYQNRYFEAHGLPIRVYVNQGQYAAQKHVIGLKKGQTQPWVVKHNRRVREQNVAAITADPARVLRSLRDRAEAMTEASVRQELARHIADEGLREQLLAAITALPEFYRAQQPLEVKTMDETTTATPGREGLSRRISSTLDNIKREMERRAAGLADQPHEPIKQGIEPSETPAAHTPHSAGAAPDGTPRRERLTAADIRQAVERGDVKRLQQALIEDRSDALQTIHSHLKRLAEQQTPTVDSVMRAKRSFTTAERRLQIAQANHDVVQQSLQHFRAEHPVAARTAAVLHRAQGRVQGAAAVAKGIPTRVHHALHFRAPIGQAKALIARAEVTGEELKAARAAFDAEQARWASPAGKKELKAAVEKKLAQREAARTALPKVAERLARDAQQLQQGARLAAQADMSLG